jgi:sodium transport system permease protein
VTVPVRARAARPGPVAGPAVPATLAGLAFLAARPGLEALPPGARTAVLAAGYIALGLAAAATATAPCPVPATGGRGGRAGPPLPGARPAPAIRAGAVLLSGMAALAAAVLVAGPAPPSPAGVAALALSLLAAVAEEALFRGALYGVLERWGPALAIGVSAVLFALAHVPSYGPSAVPVDLGAGLLFGWQRWASGRWAVPAATHAAANLLAVILR